MKKGSTVGFLRRIKRSIETSESPFGANSKGNKRINVGFKEEENINLSVIIPK